MKGAGRTIHLRKVIIRMSVYVLLGAVVNIAVGWGCIMVQGWVEQPWLPHHNPSGENPLVILLTQMPGYAIVSGCDRPGSLLDKEPGSIRPYDGTLWWQHEAVEPNSSNYGIASGFPLLALTAWRTVLDGDEMSFPGHIHGGIFVRSPAAPALRMHLEWIPVILPYRPLWPGFAINTLFYAAILWLLFAAPFASRRWRRIKRGLCPACAYPIGTSPVCTECGGPVKARSVEPAPL